MNIKHVNVLITEILIKKYIINLIWRLSIINKIEIIDIIMLIKYKIIN